MKPSTPTLAIPISLVVIGIALGAAGIYVGDTDDAPGAALLGLLMMIVMVTIGGRQAWRRSKMKQPL